MAYLPLPQDMMGTPGTLRILLFKSLSLAVKKTLVSMPLIQARKKGGRKKGRKERRGINILATIYILCF